jgi:hypothetical protein
MARNALVRIEVPLSRRQIRLPKGVDDRLQTLLDSQEQGRTLTAAEKREAKGLVELSEMLSLMKLRAERVSLAVE